MGTWGTGLYSDDYAMDLRSTVAAVAKLPFDGDRLVEILCEAEADVANDPEDEGYNIFWLVVADQFQKRQIASDRVRETALSIIDSGRDINLNAELEMTEKNLAKRKKALADLRKHIAKPIKAAKPRKMIRKPQPLVMQPGDVYAFPTCKGAVINPYASEALLKHWGWKQDGWRAVAIVETGRVFDFIPWYRPLVIVGVLKEKPSIDALRTRHQWTLERPGTGSAKHLARMKFEKLDQFRVDVSAMHRVYKEREDPRRAAILDGSVSNSLNSNLALRMYDEGADRNAYKIEEAIKKGLEPVIRGLNQITAKK